MRDMALQLPWYYATVDRAASPGATLEFRLLYYQPAMQQPEQLLTLYPQLLTNDTKSTLYSIV